ncbi:extracellular solute-binding protein [Streptomyces glaucosporus]|uniref:Extracellular solute-binding protein n=1 Tax=Streptomyces glaucosporus TaxID=284044 RepID=A0ABN3IY76_9ACTN
MAGLLCLLLAAGPAGCARQGDETDHVLTVLGPWTGREEKSFRNLLNRFEQQHEGVRVDYQGTTATREVLLSGVLAGDPPDVAVLPVLGDLADYVQRKQLWRLGEDIVDDDQYGGPWLSQPTGLSARYWLPVKVDLKSIVWYEKGSSPGASAREDVSRWCIGMGSDATSGWPGSDWIEDILLQRSGADAYDAWATGEMDWTAEPVVDAWRTWGAFMSRDDRAAETALTTDHRGPEGGNGLLFDRGRDCDLEHQGSFARNLYGDDASRADFVASPMLLPGADGQSGYREVSGDFAAMFKESEQARDLMRFLASLEAQRAWATGVEPPFFSAHRGVTQEAYPEEDTVSRRIVREFRQAERLCLDASDVMPPTIRRIFHEKVLEFLADPRQDPVRLLRQIQRVKNALPEGTPWLERACG